MCRKSRFIAILPSKKNFLIFFVIPIDTCQLACYHVDKRRAQAPQKPKRRKKEYEKE